MKMLHLGENKLSLILVISFRGSFSYSQDMSPMLLLNFSVSFPTKGAPPSAHLNNFTTRACEASSGLDVSAICSVPPFFFLNIGDGQDGFFVDPYDPDDPSSRSSRFISFFPRNKKCFMR